MIIPLVPLPVDRVRRRGLLTLYLRLLHRVALVPLRQGRGGALFVDIALSLLLLLLLLLFEELLLLLMFITKLIVVLLLWEVMLVLVVDQVEVVRVKGLDGWGLHQGVLRGGGDDAS